MRELHESGNMVNRTTDVRMTWFSSFQRHGMLQMYVARVTSTSQASMEACQLFHGALSLSVLSPE